MVKRRAIQLAVAMVALALAAGAIAPFVNAESYRVRIQAGLEKALGREVKVGKVWFNVFTGPGFTVEDVEIADDPSIGLEPLAYVETLEARVSLGSMFSGKPAFSNLKLKRPRVNLVKGHSGVWNFQLLKSGSGALPTIQVREGRINFKFDDTKSVLYLSESDLDISPIGDTRMDVRFAGQPARTDQAAQTFGMLLARGVWKRPEQGESVVDVNAEMERSAVSELARIIEGRPIGLHGLVSSKAHISGPISQLSITGQLKIEDVHRWDILPKGGALQLNYKGQLDLVSQRLEIRTANNPDVPVQVRLHASELLSTPRWAATADIRDIPAATLIEAARHMGVVMPEKTEVEGKLSGAIGYAHPGGFQGRLTASDAVFRSAGAPVMKFRSADIVIGGNKLAIGPAAVETDKGGTATIESEYDIGTQALDVAVDTPEMATGELQASMGVRVPLLAALENGKWRGKIKYHQAPEEPAVWSGDFEVRDARMSVPGIAEPVRIASAAASIDDKKLWLTKIRGRAGAAKFTADYRSEASRADRLTLEIAEAQLGEIENLLMPALRRRQGLFARLRLQKPPVPEWLRDRKVEGAVKIERLLVEDQVWRIAKGRLTWNGVTATLAGIEANKGDVEATGTLTVNLAGPLPRYHFTGELGEFEFRSGSLSVEGTIETNGTGAEILANAHAEGTFEGKNVALGPEAQFNTIGGDFDWSAGTRLKLTNIQAAQGLESYTGQGVTQADGKLAMELTSGRHQVKVAAAPLGKP